MNNQPLNIVMFNMSKYSDWQKGIANRNYHVLHNLAKSEKVNKIISVDFLPFTWKKAVKTILRDQILGDTKGEIIYGDLTSRCWQVSSKILVYSTIDNLLNKERIISELNRIIDSQDMRSNLVIWNYNPLYTDYIDSKLQQKLNIFDAVDDWTSHSSYKTLKKKLQHNYQTIADKSDLIFTVSQSLVENLFNSKPTGHWLPNAVDLEYFQSQTKISDKLKNLPQPIIGFLGIIQDRLDLDILTYLAQHNPDKSLVLAGPIWPNFPIKKLQKYTNVHFLGQISHWDIPSLYNGFNVGIIPYKNNQFIRSTDPMKYYEYLAANLPIVSTPTPGIERFGDLIKIGKTPEEFNDLVNQALKQNNGELTETRLELLKNNTWQYRVDQMLELLYEKLN